MFVKRSLHEKDKNEKVWSKQEINAYTQKVRQRVKEWEKNKEQKAN